MKGRKVVRLSGAMFEKCHCVLSRCTLEFPARRRCAILFCERTSQDIKKRKLTETRSAAFATLARKLSGASTKLEAARIIAQTAQQLLGWDACNLDLYDSDRDVVIPMLRVDTIEGRRIDITVSSDLKPTARSRRVIDQGPELVLRKDPIQFDKEAVPFGDTLRPSASIMTAPVQHASRIVGLLSIQSYSPLAYDAAALNDLQSLADHCGEALNRISIEESLYESEERFRQMAYNFEDVVWLADKDISKVLHVNPAYERIFRCTSESLHERLESFLDRVHPEDRAAVELALEKGRKGLHEPVEYRIIWPDGSIRWILRRTFPIRNTEGAIHLVGGIAQDITDRKRVEETLKQSEVYFRSLIEHAADTISTYDANGVRLYTSPSIERVLGYTPEEMIGRSGFELLHPDDLPLLSSLFAQEVQFPGTKVTRELRCRHKDGTWRTLESTGSNLLDDPAVGAIVLNSRDITVRRRAEAALRESEERYRDLVENSRELICTHDLDGLILSANRAALEVLGYDHNDFVGKRSIRDILAPEFRHRFDEYMARVHEDGATSGIMVVLTSSGERRMWEFYNSLRTEGVATPIVRGMARDITEQKRAQDALQTYSRRLIEAQEAERQHIARELHDEIGQVLTAVKINLQSIQRLSSASTQMPQLEESIGIVDEALGCVRQLSIELRPALLDDLGLSAALRWYVNRYAQRTGIMAEVINGFEENDRLPREFETACFRIAQEALTNVARHAQAVSVSVQLEQSRERMLLTITDDGVGFDVDKLFNRASAAAVLGLRGMEERALALGGKIEIESALQKGTRVRATFPLNRK